jgi:hypothetical protein
MGKTSDLCTPQALYLALNAKHMLTAKWDDLGRAKAKFYSAKQKSQFT